jgi:tetratricopeptide (TPR) repeat protein
MPIAEPAAPAGLRAIAADLEAGHLEEVTRALQALPWPQPDPFAQLLRGETLRRQGHHGQARPWLEAACRQGEAQGAGWQAQAWHALGLNTRSQGDFAIAAEAFLQALAHDPGHQVSYHALQFTSLEPAWIEILLPRLEATVARVPRLPLALMVLAQWQRCAGRVEAALTGSYRAAQLSCRPCQRPLLDRVAAPTLPEALIIGAPKSGTTSLLAYLSEHPGIWAHPRKELHFFDAHWDWGEAWYRCQFPVFRPSSGVIRMEATPNLLQLPECPERVAQLMPAARLIVLLREPLARALSWFQHLRRQEGLQGEAEEVLLEEQQRLEQLSAAERSRLGWWAPNCLSGSLYAQQVERWRSFFPPEQLLILRLEDLRDDPETVMALVHRFLGLNPTESSQGHYQTVHNDAPDRYADLPPALAEAEPHPW